MAGQPPLRVVVVDTNLLDVDMHNFNFARGLWRDGPGVGLDPQILMPVRAPDEIADAVAGHRVLSFSAAETLMDDGLSWRIAETIDGGARLADDLAALRGAAALADAVVLLPTASSREMMALALAIERTGPPRAIVLGFHSLRTGDPDRRPTNQVLGLLRYAMNRLRQVFPAERILANATTGLLARDLAEVLRHPFRIYPHPIWYDLTAAEPSRGLPPADGRTTIAVLGGTRADKGGALLAEIAGHAAPLADRMRLLVQLMPRTREKGGVAIGEGIRPGPLVAVYRGVMPEATLLHCVRTVDAVLLPYEPGEYRDRASGIFALAVAMGRPVIVPADTWMAERLQAGEATGLVVSQHTARGYAQAMARLLVDPGQFLRAAASRAEGWRMRENGVRYLEAMIRDLDRAGIVSARAGQMASSG